MSNLSLKNHNQEQRKNRVRSKIIGTSQRPRLCVNISNKNVCAQLIDDTKQATIAYSTSVGMKIDGALSDLAAAVGVDIAQKAKKAKVSSVVFDRRYKKYAKRLSALADAARKEGLEF